MTSDDQRDKQQFSSARCVTLCKIHCPDYGSFGDEIRDYEITNSILMYDEIHGNIMYIGSIYQMHSNFWD